MAKEEILIDVLIDAAGSAQTLAEVAASTRELTKAKREQKFATEEGRKAIDLLNQQINKNNEVIKANASALEKQKINIGAYKNDILAAAKETDVFGINVGSATTKIASFANPVTATIGILGSLTAAYARSTTGAKDLEFASNQLSEATTILTNKFANLFSSAEDGQGFFSRATNAFLFYLDPETAITAQSIALATEKIQDLEREEIALRETINDRLQNNQDKLTQIQSEQTTINEKARLAKEIQNNLKLNLTDQLNLKNQELKQLELISQIDKDSESKQQAVLEKKREISNLEKDTAKQIERTQRIYDNIVEGEQKKKEAIQQQNDLLAAQAEIKQKVDAQKDLDRLRELNTESLNIQAEGWEAYDELENKRYENDLERANQQFAVKDELRKKEIEAERQKQSLLFGLQMAAIGLGSQLFGKNKGIASALAGLSTYLTAQKAYESQFLPVPDITSPVRGAIAAGIAVVQGLGNIAAINGIQFAKGGILKLHNGGLLQGPSHANGGIPFSIGGRLGFEAEGGEAIINKRSTSMFRPILSQINAAGGGVPFENGGVLGFPSSSISTGSSPFMDFNKIKELIQSQPIVVTVEDINKGLTRVAQIEDRATF